MADEQRNPYVGPRTFEEDDAQFFFGRDREARELLSLVISEPLVLFYAESGAGKSSIINTRLIPGLREEQFFMLPTGRVGGNLPDELEDVPNIFVFNLLASLDKGKNTPQALSDLTIVEYLRMFKMSSAEEDDTFYDEEGDESARVLIIDQFEEIVTTNLDRWQDRAGFFEQLSEAIKEDQLLWVVLTLREDYVASLEPYAKMMPNRLRARFYMQRMKARAAEQAIEQPAMLAERPFAAGVARTLVDNLRQLRTGEGEDARLGEYVEPVQLQVVCYQLWNNLQDRPLGEITAQDLEELGNVDQALGEFYEHALAAVLREVQVSEVNLRNWFERHLITEAGTRGTVYQGAAETAGMPNEVVRLLADQYLLRAEPRAGGMWYELVHDRFVEPILLANQAWRLRQSPLLRAAEEWDRSGRERSKLYTGNQLAEAMGSGPRDQMEPIVQEFLTASEEAESQKKLEAAQEAAEEQRLRADEQARAARRLRWLTTGLVIVAIMAIGISAYAFVQQGRATTNEQIASTRSAEAQENAVLVATEAARALENAELAAVEATKALESQQTAVALSTVAGVSASQARTKEAEAQNNNIQLQTREAESIVLLRDALDLFDEALENLTPTPIDPDGFEGRVVDFETQVDEFEIGTTCKEISLHHTFVEGNREAVTFTGQDFTLVLEILNDTLSGTCPWAPNMFLRYESGEGYGVNYDIPLEENAYWFPEGEQITLIDSREIFGGEIVFLPISDLRAPSQAGFYETQWQLYDGERKRFGQVFTSTLEVFNEGEQAQNESDSEILEPLDFDIFIRECDQTASSWSCEIGVTAFGGSGKYSVVFFDQSPPRREPANKDRDADYDVGGNECESWRHEIEIQDVETDEVLREELVISPFDAGTALLNLELLCGEDEEFEDEEGEEDEE